MFNIYEDLKKVVVNSKEYYLYTREDLGNIFEMVHQLRNTDYVKPFYIWDIPKKTHNNDYYERGELTEEDKVEE